LPWQATDGTHNTLWPIARKHDIDNYTFRAVKEDQLRIAIRLGNISVFARQPLRVSLTNLVPAALEEMAYIYPQKKAYVGESGLETLIRQAVAAARSCGFSTDRAVPWSSC
jgi:hypothetical protein